MKLLRPSDPAEAVRFKKDNPDARYVTGGTEVFSHQMDKPFDGKVINLLDILATSINISTISAAATMESLRLSKDAPDFIREAASHIGSLNIRNVGTIGGNIATNRSSSDIIPTLLAAAATLTIADEDGQSNITVEKWINAPKGIILSINLPELDIRVFSRKFTRTANDIALLNLAVGYTIKDGVFSKVRVAVGCIAPIVIRLVKAENYLTGKRATEIETEKLKEILLEEASPATDQRASKEYRLSLLNAGLSEFLRTI